MISSASKSISRLRALVGLLGPEEFDSLALQLLPAPKFTLGGGFGAGLVGLGLRRSDQLFAGGFDEFIALIGFGWGNLKGPLILQ